MSCRPAPCTFPDCDHPIDSGGFCTAHRSQRSRTGTMWPLWSRSRRIEDVIEDCEALAGSASANQIAERLGYASRRGIQ